MKTRRTSILLFAAALLLAGCFRNDIRTEVFQVDQIRSAQGAQLAAQALRSLPGIKEIRTDPENHTCTVVFDGLVLYKKNIEYAFVKAGFDLPHWPAEAADKAKLPKELQ